MQEYKYIGINVISSLYDDNDIMRQMRSFGLYIRGNVLARNFMYCSDHCYCLFAPICIAVIYGHLLRRVLLTNFVRHIIIVLECFLKLPRSCSACHMFVYNSVLSFGELLRTFVYNFILMS